MLSTTLLAQIIGPIMLAIALTFILNKKFYSKIAKDYEKHDGLIYLSGVFVMLLGLIMVLNHNIWEFSAAGVVTLLAWATLIKGIFILVTPSWYFQLVRRMLRNENLPLIASGFALLIGIYLTWFGFLF
jgi:predicted tellurium resistance membrane protein TerC